MLFLCALLTGAAVPAFANPRMGLSAHLTGVECGLLLMVLGLLWPKLRLGERASALAQGANATGAWALWLAFTVGAALGTGEATPLAGAGFQASPAAEGAVRAILYLGVAGTLWGALAVVVGLARAAPRGA